VSKLTADAIANAVPHLADGVQRLQSADGQLRLRGPELRTGRVRRTMAKIFGLAERVEVELDDIGAFVIDRFDGRSLEALATDLAAHLKLRQREAEGALTTFLQALLKRKLLRLDFERDRAAA